MDLKSVALLGNSIPKVGWRYLDSRPSGVAFNLLGDSQKVSKKWMSFGALSGSSACGGIRSLEDEELQRLADQRQQNVSKRSQKDLSLFPSALSYCRFSNSLDVVRSCNDSYGYE